MRDTPSAELTSQGCRRFKPYPAYKDSGIDWLGEIPAHWKCLRENRLRRLNRTFWSLT